MKNKLLVSIIAISAAACAPDIKNPYIGSKIYGSSNDVIFEIDGVDENFKELPAQLTVNLEKPDEKFSKIIVSPFFWQATLPPKDGIAKIGCDNSSMDMPEVLNVDTIVLCGNLVFEKKTFDYTANTIIFNSTNLTVISTFDDIKYFGANFRAKSKIILNGQSYINLQGRNRSDNAGLELAPRLTMATPTLEADGHLEINSKSSYIIYGK